MQYSVVTSYILSFKQMPVFYLRSYMFKLKQRSTSLDKKLKRNHKIQHL